MTKQKKKLPTLLFIFIKQLHFFKSTASSAVNIVKIYYNIIHLNTNTERPKYIRLEKKRRFQMSARYEQDKSHKVCVIFIVGNY